VRFTSTEAHLTGVALAETVIPQMADETMHRLLVLVDQLCNRSLATPFAAAVTGNTDGLFVLVWFKISTICH